jgi:hypothetical protein
VGSYDYCWFSLPSLFLSFVLRLPFGPNPSHGLQSFVPPPPVTMPKYSKKRPALNAAVNPGRQNDCCVSCYSKCYLYALNLVALVLGSVLIYYGATNVVLNALEDAKNMTRNATAGWGNSSIPDMERKAVATMTSMSAKAAAKMFGSAWITVVVIGVCMDIVALFGIVGVWTKKVGCLFAYLVMLMVVAAGLLYASFFCYFFADDAAALVDYYWKYLSDGNEANATVLWIEGHIRGAATLCLISAFMLVTALFATTNYMGALFTFRNFMNIVNTATFIIGLLVISVSVITSLNHLGGQWLPYFLAVLGSFTSLLSLLGFCAVRKESLRMMQTYFCCLTLLILLFMTSSILAFYYASVMEEYLVNNWYWLEDKVAPGYSEKDVEFMLRHHMNKLGISSAVVVIVLLFNSCGSLYMWRRIRREETALNDEELEVLRLESGVLEDSDED